MMLVKRTFRISVFMLLTAALYGQVGPKLQINVSEEKINRTATEKKGGESIYTPGDTIQYTVTSLNVGDALMTNAVITDPIPEGVTFILGSSESENVSTLFSIDGGTEYTVWPVYYSVRNSRGIIIRREATADMITHIRWEIQGNLDAGASHMAKFKVVVNQ